MFQNVLINTVVCSLIIFLASSLFCDVSGVKVGADFSTNQHHRCTTSQIVFCFHGWVWVWEWEWECKICHKPFDLPLKV